MVLSVSLCYGVSPCYDVYPHYAVNTCYGSNPWCGLNPCFGVYTYYGVILCCGVNWYGVNLCYATFALVTRPKCLLWLEHNYGPIIMFKVSNDYDRWGKTLKKYGIKKWKWNNITRKINNWGNKLWWHHNYSYMHFAPIYIFIQHFSSTNFLFGTVVIMYQIKQ